MPWIKREPIETGRNRRKPLRDNGPVSEDSQPERMVLPSPGEGATLNLRERPTLDGLPGQFSESHSLTATGKGGKVVLSYRSLFFWLSGISVLMVWIFILGVIVGKGTIFEHESFKELEQQLSIETANSPPPQVEISGTAGSKREQPKPDAQLTFYDTLDKRNPSPQRGLPKPKKPPEVPLPAADRARANASSTASKPAKVPTAVNETAPKPASPIMVTSGVRTVEEARSAAPPPKRKAGHNYTVQVSAADSAEKAEVAVNKLRKQGYDAYYYQVELNGRTYFRIRVGRYSTREEAKATMANLTAQGKNGLFISVLTD